jgi:hypothetical protein
MITGRSFIVDSDIYLVNPANRAYVEGKAARPAVPILWYVGLIDLPISIILLGLGANVLPIPLPEYLESMRWIFLVIGLVTLSSSVFIMLYVRRISLSGTLVEGRVVKAELKPKVVGSRQMRQFIYIEFTDPDGKRQQTMSSHTPGFGRELPTIGAQAAVLYAGKNHIRVL